MVLGDVVDVGLSFLADGALCLWGDGFGVVGDGGVAASSGGEGADGLDEDGAQGCGGGFGDGGVQVGVVGDGVAGVLKFFSPGVEGTGGDGAAGGFGGTGFVAFALG